MRPDEALAFVEEHGVVLESAKGPVPNLADIVAGEPIQGSYWAHPKGNEIFLLTRAIRSSEVVVVCRIVRGKITYVHRRLWPALVRLQGSVSKKRLAAIREIHTPTGKHEVSEIPFPDWVPAEVEEEANELTHLEARSALGEWSKDLLPKMRERSLSACH
ncbi:hypothetical protein MYX65_08045 [Acidobacteria bacterium AH-259-L09]|nr:hypothetical protein [Acidobacteria bacterium AH-259-L09]